MLSTDLHGVRVSYCLTVDYPTDVSQCTYVWFGHVTVGTTVCLNVGLGFMYHDSII